MKQQCSKCGIEKSLEEFPRRSDRPSGRRSSCLVCGRIYRRQHYLANIPYYLAKAHLGRAVLRGRNYQRAYDYLRTHPCVDCGESDIRVLEFDHLDPALKITEVSKLLGGASWSRVLLEMEKCAVRCGNCHRRKTLRDLRSRRSKRGLEEQRGPWSLREWAIIDARAVSSVDRAPTF